MNDLLEHAHALVRLLRPLGPRGSHVNLIPLNDTEGYEGTAPVPVRIQAFATVLRSGGLTATVRRNRGTDIDAACGQLRSRVSIGADRSHRPHIRRIVGKNGAVNDFRLGQPVAASDALRRHDPLLHRRRLRADRLQPDPRS